MIFDKYFDVIVVGGGHAGTEASLIASKMGNQTLLITHNIETLGQMSCNPSIGGIGKGHLVKEIDALGGIMALAADHAGIQFRILNSSKGMAVRATRAQADRILYKAYIRNKLENQTNLTIFQDSVDDLIINNNQIEGIVTALGITFKAKTVILTNGTFLGGKIHVGLNTCSGGRMGDIAANVLSRKLHDYNLPMARLKTGTPPRLDGRTINFSQLIEQKGDSQLPTFSFTTKPSCHPHQISCFITHTNIQTHDIIRNNLDRSPMFTGVIEGIGPRYCPSIEDKIHRFASKDSHQIFLEPEGLNTHEIYPNGISTSLPFDTQIALVHSICGLENAHILRSGYAIEYDYFNPIQLKLSLESKLINNLFFAGQINGTTGYEEAAAQGLLAGINAALKVKEQEAWYPKRHEAYLGVLVDDLTSKGLTEPYRMFTSRAEYRLQLREDNADLRLTPIAHKLGTIDENRWQQFCHKKTLIDNEINRLKTMWVNPNILSEELAIKLFDKQLEHEYSYFDLLKRPNVTYQDIMQLPNFYDMNSSSTLDQDVDNNIMNNKSSANNNINNDYTQHLDDYFLQVIYTQIATQIKYDGYIVRQHQEINKNNDLENIKIPYNFDYAIISGLSNEVIQKLNKFKPENIAQASRISGVTPAAISLLIIYAKRGFSSFDKDT